MAAPLTLTRYMYPISSAHRVARVGSVVQRAVKDAVRRAEIAKRAGPRWGQQID
jgi:hypothetical protein